MIHVGLYQGECTPSECKEADAHEDSITMSNQRRLTVTSTAQYG